MTFVNRDDVNGSNFHSTYLLAHHRADIHLNVQSTGSEDHIFMLVVAAGEHEPPVLYIDAIGVGTSPEDRWHFHSPRAPRPCNLYIVQDGQRRHVGIEDGLEDIEKFVPRALTLAEDLLGCV
jgi:hypothetical protein